MKLFKNILVSFLSAMFTVMLVYGGYTIYAAGDEKASFKEYGLSFSQVFDRYHGQMNDYLNGKIKKLNVLLENPKFFTDPNFSVPKINPQKENLTEIVKKCGEDNVSSYCVSMGALAIYMDYVNVLQNLLGTLEKPAGGALVADDILAATSSRNEDIKKELEDAKKVMKATLAVYNEYRLAYPMHKKYEEVIKNLIQYKLTMKDLMKQSSQFPINFIDATTSQCD